MNLNEIEDLHANIKEIEEHKMDLRGQNDDHQENNNSLSFQLKELQNQNADMEYTIEQLRENEKALEGDI